MNIICTFYITIAVITLVIGMHTHTLTQKLFITAK